jgi:hypothetical protein
MGITNCPMHNNDSGTSVRPVKTKSDNLNLFYATT